MTDDRDAARVATVGIHRPLTLYTGVPTVHDLGHRPIPTFPPRAVLEDYILGRAKKSGVRQHIRFNTAIRWVDHDEVRSTFDLTVESLDSGETHVEQFDYVIVATGHFSVPNLPEYPGFEQFPGRIMHSHDFRDAQEFADRDLLVVGGSYSAEDIALQAKKYGARSVTISYRSSAMGFPWPDGIDEVPLLTHVDGKTVHFTDGTTRDVDAIILCTGYKHHFPFMASDLRLTTKNMLYPPDLYKGVFWTPIPNLMYLSMQDQFYTFTMFDAEAWYARDHVLGRVELPERAQMDADIESWRAREDALPDAFAQIDFQADHIEDLLRDVDYPPFDLDLTREHFKKWEHDKEESIIGYRDRGFSSPCTGTDAPVHHTAWWEATDDSLTTFLGASRGHSPAP